MRINHLGPCYIEMCELFRLCGIFLFYSDYCEMEIGGGVLSVR